MPISAIARSEIEQAATRNGFPIDPEPRGDWLLLRSPWTRHEFLAGHDGGVYRVATFSGLIAQEMAGFPCSMTPVEGTRAVFLAESAGALHELVQRLYQLARSLPPEPLEAFEAKTRDLPRTTEAERLVVQRIGQNVFRQSLMEYWNGSCPLTGIDQPELLRASHIKAWAACESDRERLDVHNGLLLAAHLDAAFDAHLINFSDEGALLVSPRMTETTRRALRLQEHAILAPLRERHRDFLAVHRAAFQWKRTLGPDRGFRHSRPAPRAEAL
jgi:putative restriction endonuclease